MSKIAVVYWSGTGNTEMMALKVAEGAKAAGAEAALFNAAEFSPAAMDQFDAIAFGCPSMVRSSWRRPPLRRCLQRANRS